MLGSACRGAFVNFTINEAVQFDLDGNPVEILSIKPIAQLCLGGPFQVRQNDLSERSLGGVFELT